LSFSIDLLLLSLYQGPPHPNSPHPTPSTLSLLNRCVGGRQSDCLFDSQCLPSLSLLKTGLLFFHGYLIMHWSLNMSLMVPPPSDASLPFPSRLVLCLVALPLHIGDCIAFFPRPIFLFYFRNFFSPTSPDVGARCHPPSFPSFSDASPWAIF